MLRGPGRSACTGVNESAGRVCQRGGLVERCARRHRFIVVSCLGVCLLAASAGAALGTPTKGSLLAPRSSFANSAALRRSQSSPGQQGKPAEYRLSRSRYEEAVAFSHASYTLYFVSVLFVVATLIVLLSLGIAARFRNWSERMSDARSVQAFIFVPLLVFTVDLVSLPVGAVGHSLARHFEISVQGWGPWFADWGKEQVLMIGLALLLALILSAVMRKSPRRWWLYFWLASLPLSIFLTFVSPWFIDPLFNQFTPLEASQPQLVAKIEKLTARAGVPIPANRMFLMSASKKTNAVDAYVTGLGASKRVVIWDTTIQKATTNETLFIVGHELGHYVLGHVWKGVLFFAALLLVGLYALFRAFHWALGRWGGDWRIYGAEDWAAFAVLLLLVYIGMFLASPVANAFSRMQEHEADVYGLEVIHGIVPDAANVAGQSFQVLGQEDLADPDPPAFIVFWLYSHPPLSERLTFAETYDPWANGESPAYVK
ncbi:MAG TPA: M48 family metallopeptidase [Candidatus Methylomirabilis sp.]|nr:M48 family metallopeptidase [Candidatus Methylomirabilis sp.]